MVKKQGFNYFWGAFVLEWFRELRNSDLNGSDYRILFFLCEIMKIDDNTAYIKQKEIANQLHMDKGNVSKSMKKLRDKQFIVKCENGHMINPHLFYVGKRRKEEREFLRERYDELIVNEKRKLTYYLNEDEHELEVGDRNNEDESYLDSDDDLMFQQ